MISIDFHRESVNNARNTENFRDELAAIPEADGRVRVV